MKQLMIAAMQSGSGKTTLTCALLAALKKRGTAVQAFKCGPDYVDPMFHTRVLGVPSRNLDLFLQGAEGVRRTVQACCGAELAILEGAMGFYDGLAGTSDASAWQVADTLGTPVVLAVSPKGQSLTLAAQIKGLRDFRQPSHLAGVVLNQCTAGLYAHLAPIITAETGLPVLGYLPPMDEARIEGRHLGLLTAEEISDFTARYEAIAAQLEQTVNLDALLALAAPVQQMQTHPEPCAPRCRIAVARDAACSFYYADTLDALRSAGAELCFFSPLADAALPEEIGGLYMGGGYPELHAQEFANNKTMCAALLAAYESGMPMVLEGGGFLLMQQTLADPAGQQFPMAGALPGSAENAGRLQRFGYVHLTGKTDTLLLHAGEELPAHEFHYWNSTCNGTALHAQKPRSTRGWDCCCADERLYAGFPQLHFGGELPLAQRFADAAARWMSEKRKTN